MAALLACASLTAIVWQGHFALYQFPPLLAFAAYLAAVEITERLLATSRGRTGRAYLDSSLPGRCDLPGGQHVGLDHDALQHVALRPVRHDFEPALHQDHCQQDEFPKLRDNRPHRRPYP